MAGAVDGNGWVFYGPNKSFNTACAQCAPYTPMTSANLIRELRRADWRLNRVNGSHHIFTHTDRTGIVVAPHPKKELGLGVAQGHPAAGRDLNFGEGNSLRHPIAIEPGNDTTAWGVVVPDLPGCFSAGDTLEPAMIQAETAIAAWIEVALDGGQDVPAPSSIESLRAGHAEFNDWLWGLVKVKPAMLGKTIERANISLPRRVLHRPDARARSVGETRSRFIARMAVEGQLVGR